jgi:hypothetical protein
LFLQPTTHDDDDDDHDRRENYHVTNHGTNFPSFVGFDKSTSTSFMLLYRKGKLSISFAWLGRNNPINPSMLLSHITHYYMMSFNITEAVSSKAIDKMY